ncbi:hypothetical protein [Streptomyces sp. NPDC094149]|uniref:hypothetical protein n=1 Tax=Streptomyces sp. NPDC094149 TaxID=3155079 RepID=UPI0033309FC3
MPATAVPPQRVPGRHAVEVAAVHAHQQEGPVLAVGGDGGEVAGRAVLLDVRQDAVEVGGRRDARVVVHRLQRGEAARRLAEHADAVHVQRAAQLAGEPACCCRRS